MSIVLAESSPYSIQDLLNEFGSAERGEPRFIFDGTLKVTSGTTYTLAIKRFSGSGSNIYVHQAIPTGYYCIIWGSTTSSGGGNCTCDWNDVPFIHLKGNMTLDAAATKTPDPNQVIEICSKPYEFKAFNSGIKGSIVAYLRSHLSSQIGHDWNDPESAALKFTSLVNTTFPYAVPGDPNQKFSVYLSLVNFGVTSPNAGIACSRHFIVRKDLLLNGMLNSVEGAIVLHAGIYREWGGTQLNQPTQPTIFIGDTASQQDLFDTNTVEFRRFGNGYPFIPIRCSGLRDSNGNLGAHGQVLTNTNSGLLWQNAVNVTSRIEKGQVQTNSNGDDVIVNFSPAFTNQPIITTGCLDASARSISVTITSLAGQPMNDLRAGFKIHASIATNASHVHKQMSVGTRANLPSPNPANMIRSASIGDIEAVIYSIGTGGNGNTHDVNTDSAAVSQVITRVPNLTLHYIAIGT